MTANPAMQLDQPFPANEDAERAILGAVLMSNSFIVSAADCLRPEDFFSNTHRRIYKTMLDLWKSSQKIEPILISERIKAENGPADPVFGAAAITNLTFGLPIFGAFDDIAHYIDLVREKAARRQLLRTAQRIVNRAMDEENAIEDVLKETREQLDIIPVRSNAYQKQSLFKTQPVNAWMREASSRPLPRRLFGELFLQGELCILFADTGLGKSILAVQIGDAITRGQSVAGFHVDADPQKVLFFDFELSDKQFEARYSRRSSDRYYDHYPFQDSFQRSEIDSDRFDPNDEQSFDRYFAAEIEAEIVRRQAGVVIVDNITYLRSETEKAKAALPLMKELNRIKKKHGISLLVLAHTPKRDMSRPITVNDLQGSKMLSNFADSIIAIGESAKDKNVRYIKQLKVRQSEFTYDSEHVAVCQVVKPDNFLGFEFLGTGREREHLNTVTEKTRTDLIERVKNLVMTGRSQREIAKELGISVGAVNKYIKS